MQGALPHHHNLAHNPNRILNSALFVSPRLKVKIEYIHDPGRGEADDSSVRVSVFGEGEGAIRARLVYRPGGAGYASPPTKNETMIRMEHASPGGGSKLNPFMIRGEAKPASRQEDQMTGV